MAKLNFQSVPNGMETRLKTKNKSYVKQGKSKWEKKFDDAYNLLERIVDNTKYEETFWEDEVPLSCFEPDELKDELNIKSDNRNAIKVALLRKLTFVGIDARRAILINPSLKDAHDDKNNMICVRMDKLNEFPGNNVQERYIVGRAITYGTGKYESAIPELKKYYDIRSKKKLDKLIEKARKQNDEWEKSGLTY